MLENVTVNIPLKDFEELRDKAQKYDNLKNRKELSVIVHPSEIDDYHDGYKKVTFDLSRLEK